MKLVYEDGEYRAYDSFLQKDALKTAGFRWSRAAQRNDLYWFTPDASVAAPFANYADPATREQLAQAAALREASIEASRATDAKIDVPAPDGFDYMPFQRAGIAFTLDRPNVLIGDEMGLGKTIQAIGVINADVTIQTILVVCPASLKLNWKRELTRWLTRPYDVQVLGAGDTLEEVKRGSVLIVNYDVLDRFPHLGRGTFDLMIVDECHYVKNPKTKRAKLVSGLQARRRVYMTGTPIVNRPVELWPIISALDPITWTQFFPFAKRYCDAKYNGFGWDFGGASNLEELQTKLRATIMVRRLKSEVLKELPAKVRQVIELPVNGLSGIVDKERQAVASHNERLAALKAAVELAKASEDPEEYKQAVTALQSGIMVAFTEMASVRHDTAMAKVPYVIEHVTAALEAGHKVVLFAHHHDVINALREALGGVVLTGETPLPARQVAVDTFQNDETCRVFIGSITAAGLGITLTASSHVIFAELDWVPGNISQAEDRCHRIGQTDSVLVQHLVLEGSLDATMAKRIVSKQRVIDKALDEKVELVDEPLIPIMEEAATSGTTREKIEKEAPNISPERIAAVHKALQILAAFDPDHARFQNEAGFNQIDGRIGHSLAQASQLTPRQAALGIRIVTKYHRQLPEDLMEVIRGTA